MGLGEYVGYVLFIVSLIVLGAALYQLHRGGYSREALVPVVFGAIWPSGMRGDAGGGAKGAARYRRRRNSRNFYGV